MSSCRATNAKASRTRSAPAPLAVVDLFSGAGGLSEGFRQAGFDIIAGLDNDPDAVATYRHNFPEAAGICGDIRSPEIWEQLAPLLPRATVIVGGPPCQAFSQVRNHTRVIDDPRNSLYREFVRAIQVAKPLAFLVENVTGMDQMGVRGQIETDLSLDGKYTVVSQILDAADFGVPQTRKRLLFLGVRSDLNVPAPVLCGTGATSAVSLCRVLGPKRSKYVVTVQDVLGSRSVARALEKPTDDAVVTAADALSDLEFLPEGHRIDALPASCLPPPLSAYQRKMRAGLSTMLTNLQVPRINEDTALRLRSIPKGGNHRDLEGRLLDRYLTGQRWGQDNGSGRLSRRHFYAYRRLHPDIWAWTLNTKADSVYHYRYARSLSVREFARLQSFPDRFHFATDMRKGNIEGRHDGGPAHSKYRQVGNAVPPLLARAAAEKLLGLLQTYLAGAAPRAHSA